MNVAPPVRPTCEFPFPTGHPLARTARVRCPHGCAWYRDESTDLAPRRVTAATDQDRAAAPPYPARPAATVRYAVSPTLSGMPLLDRIVWPQLTTVRQPIVEMAGAAVDLILSGEAGPSTQKQATRESRLLDFEIILRQSTAPPIGG